MESRHTGQLKIDILLRLDEVQENVGETRLTLGLQHPEKSASRHQRHQLGACCRAAAPRRDGMRLDGARTHTAQHAHTHTTMRTNTPASAGAQPADGRLRQRRASQRCNFEWRRHPLWASCRANYRIKALRRTGARLGAKDGTGSQNKKQPWLSRGLGGLEKIWAKIWLAGKQVAAPKTPGMAGHKFKVR